MSKELTAKWGELETMLYETPEKVKMPNTAKASSRLSVPQNRLFKFVRNGKGETLPRSLNALQVSNSSNKYSSRNDLETSSQNYQSGGSRNYLDSKPVASFNSIEGDNDSTEKQGSRGSLSNFNRRLLSPDINKETTVIITSSARNTKKKFSLKETPNGSRNSLDKGEKTEGKPFIVMDPICGISVNQFHLLFRKKCEDMHIIPYHETEEKFISNIRKKSLGSKLCFYESGFEKKALEVLGSMVEHCSEVSQLVLRKSGLSKEGSIESFSKSLALMPNLVHLDLANNALEGSHLSILFKNLSVSKTLVSIDLSNYETDKKNKLGAQGVEAFKAFVKNNIYLQYVTLSNLMLDDDNTQVIITALEECPNLLALNLTSNVFTGKCLEELNLIFTKTSLIKLDLSHNKLKKEAATNLSKFIMAQRGEDKDMKEGKDKDMNMKEGVELILENTGLGSEVNTIFEALGRGSNIRKLDFSSNLLADIEITQFETALSENKKIQELNLTGCKLGEVGGKMLALGLKKNRGLQNLILANNNIGDVAGTQIIYSVMNNPNLKLLDLAQNKLAEESAKALQEIMKKSVNLTKYNLNYNNFDEQDGYLLQEALFFNAKIVQFDIAYTRVKFNTLEALDRIVKDNQQKIQFAAVPKLKEEVDKRQNYVSGEKHHMGRVEELDKKKEEIKRDVKRFAETLTELKSREKSPTFKKKERLVLKLSKDIKEEQPKLENVNGKIREFNTEAQLEMETMQRLIENEEKEIEKVLKRIAAKEEEIANVKKKFDPEVKLLRYEISKLLEENRFMELYNNTVNEKIKSQKEINKVVTAVAAPKVSDVFLATSELAKAKKKGPESPEKPPSGGVSETASNPDEKLSKEMEYVRKTRQARADKLIKEIQVKEDKGRRRLLRKQNSKSDNSKHEMLKKKIDDKLKVMFKDDKNKMGPISENDIKDDDQ